MGQQDETQLFDGQGQRKYLCANEARRFLKAAADADPATRAFCRLLAYTGCRISEALAVTPRRIDAEAGRIIFQTLKRRRCVYRGVPIPGELVRELQRLAHEVPEDAPLWPWCRQTAWRRVKRVMAHAGIDGAQAMPKGLRHQFGVLNAERNVPLATTQRWMGHAKSQSTAIYQCAVGAEERRWAMRLWKQR